ncbi:MAG: apolipoprotein N-acyltransferase [Paracoccus sp. (in: a-proteobacteria)]
MPVQNMLPRPFMYQRSISARLIDFILGAACALGQAPWGLWPLTIMALGLIIWRVGQATTSRLAAWHAGMAGAGYFALALNWITEPFLVQPEIHGWMAPFALVFMAIGGGLFWALPGWMAGRITVGHLPRSIAFAAGLIISDWLRGWIFTGFPWALLGHIWINTPVAQAASLIGAIGLSALCTITATLPIAFQGQEGSRSPLRRILPGTILSILLIAVFWAGGLKRLEAPAIPQNITLRLVQPNADQALKWDPEWTQIFWDRLLTESAIPPEGPLPDAVIWPETAVSFLLNYGEEALPVISEAAGTPVLMGIQRADDSRFYNSLIEISRGGQVAQIYDKFHLVPFGEYIPWGDILAQLGIGAFAAQEGYGYTSGTGPTVITPEGLPPVQPLICYEAIFPRHLRAVKGAEWLLQVTNDAWFGTRSGPFQHLAQARLRAIETGLPLMRVANTGITAAIDPLGRITSKLPLDISGHIDAALPAPLPGTIWTRIGSWPIVLAAFAAILGAGLTRRRR